jgi:hypothetical protein
MVWLFSSVHLLVLEKWEKCGCSDCLAKAGLQRAEIYDPERRRHVLILAPLPFGPNVVESYAPCSELREVKNASPSWRLPYKD